MCLHNLIQHQKSETIRGLDIQGVSISVPNAPLSKWNNNPMKKNSSRRNIMLNMPVNMMVSKGTSRSSENQNNDSIIGVVHEHQPNTNIGDCGSQFSKSKYKDFKLLTFSPSYERERQQN